MEASGTRARATDRQSVAWPARRRDQPDHAHQHDRPRRESPYRRTTVPSPSGKREVVGRLIADEERGCRSGTTPTECGAFYFKRQSSDEGRDGSVRQQKSAVSRSAVALSGRERFDGPAQMSVRIVYGRDRRCEGRPRICDRLDQGGARCVMYLTWTSSDHLSWLGSATSRRPRLAWLPQQGVPVAALLVPAAGIVALLGGLSITGITREWRMVAASYSSCWSRW